MGMPQSFAILRYRMDESRKVVLPNDVLFGRVKELVAEGHRVTFRVKGNSMNPFLVDSRDEAVVSPFERKEVCPGCIILAKDMIGRVILHRVIAVRGDVIEMMGDGNCYGTEITSWDRIAGLITAVVRSGKQISCRSRRWKTVSFLWMKCRPVRRWLLAIWRRILREI